MRRAPTSARSTIPQSCRRRPRGRGGRPRLSRSPALSPNRQGGAHAACRAARRRRVRRSPARSARRASTRRRATRPKRRPARSKARAKLLSAFAKALAKAAQGVSYTGLLGREAADEVDRIADELAASTSPAGVPRSPSPGTIQAADGSVVDSDVNDTNTSRSRTTPRERAAASRPRRARRLRQPPGRGTRPGTRRAAGNLRTSSEVSLAAGQRVNLRFGDPPTARPRSLPLRAPSAIAARLLGGTHRDRAADRARLGRVLRRGASRSLERRQLRAHAGPGAGGRGGPDGVRLSDEFVPASSW